MEVDLSVVNLPDDQTTDDNKAKKVKSKSEIRRVFIPHTRRTMVREKWESIYTPIVEHLLLQVRYNQLSKHVEIRMDSKTTDRAHLQRAADFIRAVALGFEVEDALALIRLDDLFVESFEVADIKNLKGDHLSRAIGRLAGKGGRTKFTLENSTKTRIVLHDSKIHVLGSYKNIQHAKRAMSHLILGSPASKVYGNLRNVAGKISERI